LVLPCNDLVRHTHMFVTELDWRSPPAQLASEISDARPDVILACDVVYDPDIIPSLLAVIQLALESAEEAWIAGALRNPATVQAFIGQIEDSGLVVDEVDWQLPAGERSFLGGEEGWIAPGQVKLWRLYRTAVQEERSLG